MSRNKWEALLSSRIGCIIMAVSILGICVGGVCFNIYNASGGHIESFTELKSCFGENEAGILCMGLVLFCCFMFAAKNAAKMKKIQENECDIKKEKVKLVPYTMGYGKHKITFLIPSAYSWDDKTVEVNEREGFVASPVFLKENGAYVQCYYNVATEEETQEDESLEERIQEQLEQLPQKTQQETKIQQIVFDGKHVVHYYITRYKEKMNKYQEIYAVCEVKTGCVFEFEMMYASWEERLTEKDFEPFFHF